tara:strand:- start:13 stop:246 length:234 start_codon:yes stop_codon:yes gene_type:complete
MGDMKGITIQYKAEIHLLSKNCGAGYQHSYEDTFEEAEQYIQERSHQDAFQYGIIKSVETRTLKKINKQQLSDKGSE